MNKDLDLADLFASRSRRTPTGARDRQETDEPLPVSGETVTRDPVIGETVSGETVTTQPGSAGGAAAASHVPSGSAGDARRGRPPAPVGQRWDDRVRRAAYYIDVSLLDALDGYCRMSGANKSEVVREALHAHLAARGFA